MKDTRQDGPLRAATPAAERSRSPAQQASRDDLEGALAAGLTARRRLLEKRNRDLVAVLSATARQWSRRDFEPRSRVTSQLATRLAMHADMLARGLDHLFSSITDESLGALLEEAEDPRALEQCVQRGSAARARLLGSPVVFHGLAGNVPGLAIPAIVASVLARSVAIVRDSARQPWLTEAFLATLSEHDRDAAAMIVPAYWEPADARREDEVLALAARAELYGAHRTLEAWRARHPNAVDRIVERGPRLSAGLIVGEAWRAAASGFAEDIVIYDGLGCLSPHAIAVVGERERAERFAELLAAALDELERRWSRQPRDFELEAARRAFIARCEAGSLVRDPQANGGERLLRGRGDQWAVHVSGAAQTAALEIGPGLRCVRVVACAALEAAVELLRCAPAPLAAVGLAFDGTSAERTLLEGELRRLGATLVCEPGRMQAPPLTWQQDGRRRLGDLLAWQEVEA